MDFLTRRNPPFSPFSENPDAEILPSPYTGERNRRFRFGGLPLGEPFRLHPSGVAMAADLFGLEQVESRHVDRKEAAALLEVLKALRGHAAVAWCERMSLGAACDDESCCRRYGQTHSAGFLADVSTRLGGIVSPSSNTSNPEVESNDDVPHSCSSSSEDSRRAGGVAFMAGDLLCEEAREPPASFVLGTFSGIRLQALAASLLEAPSRLPFASRLEAVAPRLPKPVDTRWVHGGLFAGSDSANADTCQGSSSRSSFGLRFPTHRVVRSVRAELESPTVQVSTVEGCRCTRPNCHEVLRELRPMAEATGRKTKDELVSLAGSCGATQLR